MRFHILPPAHTVANDSFNACAFSMKARRLSAMLRGNGDETFFYGHEDSVVDCTEMVPVVTNADWQKAYGDYDWRRELFKFDMTDHCYRTAFANTIGEIHRRKQPGDFLLCPWGFGNKPVADAHPDMIIVESGCGYGSGFFAPYRVYESYALLHAHGGLPAVMESDRLGNYSVVIPNAYGLDEFDYSAEKDDYFLFIGRLGPGKGLHVAIDACKQAGAQLVVAGQGGPSAIGLTEWPSHVRFVGYADIHQRRQLMSRARATICLSQYVEPGCGVSIESQLSGTPVICTDWGALVENVLHGLTGFRTRTFEHITWAIRNIDRIKPQTCREWAAANFSMERVALQYEEFFQSIVNVHGGAGWYEPNPDRTELDWLRRSYPAG